MSKVFLNDKIIDASDAKISIFDSGFLYGDGLFETLGLDTAKDHPTVGFLGNVGSASLPLSLAIAQDESPFGADERAVLLGIAVGLAGGGFLNRGLCGSQLILGGRELQDRAPKDIVS